MLPLINTWLQFLFCVAVIGFAGVRLSRYGDVIAEKTGMVGLASLFLLLVYLGNSYALYLHGE